MQSSWLLSVLPLLTSILYMWNEPNFRWSHFIPYVLPLLVPLFMNFNNSHVTRFIPRIREYFWKTNGCEFNARLSLRIWRDEPDSIVRCFSTVLYDWNKTNRTVNCRHLVEEFYSCSYWSENETDRDMTPFFVDSADTEFWNTERPEIRYTMWSNRNTDRDGNEQPVICLRIHYVGSEASPQKLMNHIQFLREEAARIRKDRKQIQRVLVSQEKTDEESCSLSFLKFEFATTSSFANFFSEEADSARQDIDYFMTKKEEYIRTGRPWNYTVLNEGPPGVGKTKLVKAIAAYTGRTLIVLNLEHIHTLSMLYELFHSSLLGGEHIDHTKRLYYIPEVDTQLHSFLKERTEPANVMALCEKDAETKKEEKKSTWKSQKLPSLGEILNILDGIPERHGHILVMDTNHRRNLDAALIRPGRVDRILTWGKMSGPMSRRFVENYYGKPTSCDTVFPQAEYTAAELQARVQQSATLEDFVARLPSRQNVVSEVDFIV